MRLPDFENAIVDDSKVAGYLLCEEHEDGRGKAEFFKSFGFSLKEPVALKQALLDLVRKTDVAIVQPSPHGTKYTVEGAIRAPDGRSPVVKSIWMIDHGTRIPRLITAFPGKRLSR
jgi:hypothetical protein